MQQRGVGAALAHVEREAAEQRPEHPGSGAPEAVQVEGEPEQDEQVGHGHAAQVQVGGGPHVPVAPDQQHRHRVAAHPDGEQAQAHGGHWHQRPQGEGRATALVARQQLGPRRLPRALRAVAAVLGAAYGRAAPPGRARSLAPGPAAKALPSAAGARWARQTPAACTARARRHRARERGSAGSALRAANPAARSPRPQPPSGLPRPRSRSQARGIPRLPGASLPTN